MIREQKLVRALAEVAAADRAAVGGKGASLGELIRAGIRVPDGYVVTVAAFEAALARLDPGGSIRREIARLPAGNEAVIARATARIRARIREAPVPADVAAEIVACYRRLGDGPRGGKSGGLGARQSDGPRAGQSDGPRAGQSGGPRAAQSDGLGAGQSGGPRAGQSDGLDGGESGAACTGQSGGARMGEGGRAGGAPVAVRSSATGEDAAETSFAGLQDSYLWVRGEREILARIRDCWASLYNAESVGYRLRLKLAEQDVAMAVVVQRMVEPRCAGVMFTCSPTTGDRSVIAVEGCWGLGSALVSGDVTPDSFVVSKVTGEIVRRTVSVKLRMHLAGAGGAGVAVADVPAPLQEASCLDDRQIAALAQLGRRVEDHYGRPQDIEWAITEGASPAESVVLLQSRPETVWARRHSGPVATAKASPVDHVFEQLSRVNAVIPPATATSSATATPPGTATRPER
jgi:phosphoenolpyruvate synthase/pyruvate phosphate dikinase